jgi:leader peptidase (prepilin peptidase)/N-methyltransferase
MWPLLGATLGRVAGSFLATLVLRWPAGATLSGRSACDHCAVALGAAELVPILSFLRQRGRCRHCGAAIDRRHPLIEAMAAAIGALALVAVPGWAGFAGALFGWMLLALLVLDVEHFWLPDALTFPMIGLGLLLGPGDWQGRLLGMAAGGGAFLALKLAYRALRGRDGLGMGDVKLMAALGAWLSFASLPPLLLGSALAGLAFTLLKRLRGEETELASRIPFGACMALVAFPLWLLGAAVTMG